MAELRHLRAGELDSQSPRASAARTACRQVPPVPGSAVHASSSIIAKRRLRRPVGAARAFPVSASAELLRPRRIASFELRLGGLKKVSQHSAAEPAGLRRALPEL